MKDKNVYFHILRQEDKNSIDSLEYLKDINNYFFYGKTRKLRYLNSGAEGSMISERGVRNVAHAVHEDTSVLIMCFNFQRSERTVLLHFSIRTDRNMKTRQMEQVILKPSIMQLAGSRCPSLCT